MQDSRPTKSIRFLQLKAAINKALVASRNHFDIEAAVQKVYGDDATIFGGDNDNSNVLLKVFESTLDTIHDEATEYMNKVLEEEQIEQVLLKLETVMYKLQVEESLQKQLDEIDKQSALEAVELAKRPNNVTTEQVIRAQALGELTTERDRLRQELDRAQEEMHQLEEECQKQEAEYHEKLNEVQQAAYEMDKTADVASTVHA